MLMACAFAVSLQLVGKAQQPVFRSSVELIAVDAQVMDGDGYPVGQLTSNAFHVSINGKQRKVVSAEFIRHANVAPPVKRTPPVPAADPPPPAGPGRTLILAVDNGSFGVGMSRAAMDAAGAFVQRLEPDDRIGLFVSPKGSWIPPTTDRMPVRARLANLIGEKEPLRSVFNLKPHEIVDITTESQNPFSFLTRSAGTLDPSVRAELDPVLRIQQRECPGEADCPARIFAEGIGLAVQLEHESQMSLMGVEALLRILSFVPGRKSVVLITGGVLVSDKPEGRPDVGDLGRVLGQTAARANATIYTVHVDLSASDSGSASKPGFGSTDPSRDRAMFSNWLEEFSRAAGGKRINVPSSGAADFAFDRVLRETSAYYLLGVEPADADRDGLPRELKVKVDHRGATVRNRQWVVIPARRKT